MQDQYNLGSVKVVKRQQSNLPSLRQHVLRALIIFLAAIVVFIGLTKLLSNPDDAIALGEIGLEPVPLPESVDTLDGPEGALPDLLQGEVPAGANPTEAYRTERLNPVTGLDALGNPLGGGRPDIIAGEAPKPAPSPVSTTRASTGPTTILINGRPMGEQMVRSPLRHAPIAGLSRPSPFGPVPKPARDGRKAVTAYARPFSPAAGKNTVALIVGGLGIDQAVTERAITELPPDVTLSFAAHASGLQKWIKKARENGHEVLLEFPMESAQFDPTEPGADHALKTDVSASRNIRNLDWLMSRGLGYFAVINYNGDVLTQRADVLAPIFTHLSDAGLGFIFDGSNSAPTLSALASSVDLPFKQAHTLLDTINSPSAIQTEFVRLEAHATSGRTPIGVGFAYGTTIDQIKLWVAGHSDKNLQLAPASYALGRAG